MASELCSFCEFERKKGAFGPQRSISGFDALDKSMTAYYNKSYIAE